MARQCSWQRTPPRSPLGTYSLGSGGTPPPSSLPFRQGAKPSPIPDLTHPAYSPHTIHVTRAHVQLLAVTLEKQVKSLAPKFDFWRSLVTGHPEIDTHQIVSEANQQSARMLDPGQLDPVQLQNMGLGHLSGMGGGGGRPSWD